MKYKMWILLVSLFTITSLLAQEFVEEFRSQPGRRPPIQKWKVEEGESIARDLNDNGAPDIPMLVEDENGNDTLVVRDGKSRQTVWSWVAYETWPKQITDFYGFYDMRNDGSILALTELGEIIPVLIDIETNLIVWSMQNAKLLTVADPDNDGRPEILVGDTDNKQLVMIGWEEGDGAANPDSETSSVNRNLTVSEEFQLNLKFESDARLDLAYDGELAIGNHAFDANGDGVTEIIMLVEDNDGNPAGMVVRDGATHEVKWQFQFPDPGPVRDDIMNGFHGFFDINGDGQREAIFGLRTAITLDKSSHRVDENFEIQAVHDIDRDGFADLIGRGLQDSTVQVWGANNTTSISKQDLLQAGFQLQQNYPNPFNPETTINFSLERTNRVGLKIYDIQGKLVRLLVNENRPAGEYTVVWNGENEHNQPVASGSYFYQLTVGESKSTRRMILMK